MSSQKEHIELLDIAKNAVQMSAHALLGQAAMAQKSEWQSHHDIKIVGDKLSEKIILEFLIKKSGLPILSEEHGAVESEQLTDLIWIVDPLDGSLNFSRGLPLCCISIGLWQAEKPVLGVIYDFFRNELFTGIAEQGAWLNDSPIKTSTVIQKKDAILCTGFPVNTDFSSQGLQNFIQSVQQFKKVRLLGTAALSMAYVAMGRADAYIENNIMIWDVAAGIVILQAAAGHAEFSNGTKKNALNVYGTNAHLI